MKALHLGILAAACALGAFQCQRVLDSRSSRTPKEEILYLSDPEIIRRASLGHASLLADFYWLRTIQYYGSKDRSRPDQQYDLLDPLLKLAVSLDSQMILVYRFGAIFLSEPPPIGAGNVPAALALLDEGIRKNPEAWVLPYDKGFVYYWQNKDYRKAAEWFFQASRYAGAPNELALLAESAMNRQGDLETAQQLWQQRYEEATNEKVKLNAKKNLQNLRAHRDKWTLEWVVNYFVRREKHLPASWEELIQKGWLKEVPMNPWGGTYILDPQNGSVGLDEATAARLSPLPDDYRKNLWQRLDQR